MSEVHPALALDGGAAGRTRAVIDTNVLLDFWVFDDPVARPLRAIVESGQIATVRSGATVDELADVLARDKFRISVETRFELLRRWDKLATAVERVFAYRLQCTDPHDQKFLDLAATAGAQWLVTKDKALLKLARRSKADGLRIATPVQILASLSEPAAPLTSGT